MSMFETTTTTKVVRQVAFLPLVGIIFFSVSGGAYSLEALVSASGPGLALLLLVLVPAIYGIPIAAITTELSTAIPAEGGTYEWMKRSVGGFWAFQAGILRWINSWVDMAIYPVLFASYFSTLVPVVGEGEVVFFSFGPFQLDLHWVAGVVLVIIPMALLNIRGAKSVGDSALLFSVFALLPLLIVAGLGIWRLIQDGTNPFVPFMADGESPGAAITIGLSVVMWCYCGFDRVGLIAGEIKNPGKTIPKAMVVSMIVIIATYALPLIGALAIPGWEEWYAGSFSDVAAVLGGPWLAMFVTIGALFCSIGLYSSLLMSSARTPFVLSRDRWLTPVLARQSRRTGSPVVSIIVCSVIYAFFTLGSFVDLVVLDVFLINILLLMNLVALIALRIKQPTLARPTKLPWGWWGIALVGVPLVASILFLMYLQWLDYGLFAFVILAATLGASVIAYFPARWYQRRHQEPALEPDDSLAAAPRG
ncbi:APC family permease [Microbacterium trichothecenolyticum]|uniref:APC family permease n=1 Tax=Microbacterium ureisolvens TaxID=2781186 RepID=A0ABS7HZ43_9MICO|nr:MULTISPECIES: APC family permease [Microbacterium]MBW9110410.1 APC family permease [Microbacterium ureisolvens]MBW9120515.1 APC family permease [Microbacterium trichothecenolyticum]